MTEENYGIFGVNAERKAHPAIKDPTSKDHGEAIGFAPVDGQRLYKGAGGTLSMGATPRLKQTGGGSVNRAGAGSFKVRRKTLSK